MGTRGEGGGKGKKERRPRPPAGPGAGGGERGVRREGGEVDGGPVGRSGGAAELG